MTTTESELLSVELDSPTMEKYWLGATPEGDGTVLAVKWRGIPDRVPSTSGDYVAIWQNHGSVPFGQPPLAQQGITNTTPDGDVAFTGLQLTKRPYVVAYSVGPNSEGHNIAAALPIGPGGVSGPLQTTALTVDWVGSTSLSLDYTTPVGSDPKAFGHSVVLVHGQMFNPGSPPATIATSKPGDTETGIVSFNGITLVNGQWYTAAYLTGDQPSTVAATVSFLVSED